MSEQLDLERAKAAQMAAESEATSLREQMAARDAADRRRADAAALAKSVQTGGEIGALRRDFGRLRQDQEELQKRYDSTFGENGIEANNGVIRGNGATGNDSKGIEATFRCVVSFSGQAEYVRINGSRLGPAEN